ncbi:MAG: asparaginase [Acidimicrobiia bacterium]|nr:MAG: asparaginase [Acidimicrobiia bacterium]
MVASTRDGLIEAVHPVSVAAVGPDGAVLATSGETAREFFMRSAIKPVQAAVSERFGTPLTAEQRAVASASHGGWPVHVALVRAMLAGVGLDETALRCPPDRPSSSGADRVWVEMGVAGPQRVLHNCSGKHAAMLRACITQGWSLEYTPADHPLQVEILAIAEELTGRPVGPVGVDGCGVPTMRSDVMGLARAFGAVATDSRLSCVRDAARRLAPLTRDGEAPEATLARWLPVVAKGGAAGCIGVAWVEGGIGLAAKAWSGSGAAAIAAVVTLLCDLGILGGHPLEHLDEVRSPVVKGGGRPVGRLAVVER